MDKGLKEVVGKNKMDCRFDRKREILEAGNGKSDKWEEEHLRRPLSRPFRNITLNIMWKPIWRVTRSKTGRLELESCSKIRKKIEAKLRWWYAAAAAAKSLQSCPTPCDPIDGSPPGSPVPGILQARTLEWVAISFSNMWKWKVKVKLLSRVRLLATPWTATYQAPPSMWFSRQEYWSGVPLPSAKVVVW